MASADLVQVFPRRCASRLGATASGPRAGVSPRPQTSPRGVMRGKAGSGRPAGSLPARDLRGRRGCATGAAGRPDRRWPASPWQRLAWQAWLRGLGCSSVGGGAGPGPADRRGLRRPELLVCPSQRGSAMLPPAPVTRTRCFGARGGVVLHPGGIRRLGALSLSRAGSVSLQPHTLGDRWAQCMAAP